MAFNWELEIFQKSEIILATMDALRNLCSGNTSVIVVASVDDTGTAAAKRSWPRATNYCVFQRSIGLRKDEMAPSTALVSNFMLGPNA